MSDESAAPPGPFLSLESRAPGEELYRRLIDAAPDAVIVVERGGRIVLANSQAERLFGYRRDELLGQHVEILIPERFRGSHVGHRGRFFAAPKLRPMGSGLDLYGRKRDGSEFPLEISLSPLPSREGAGEGAGEGSGEGSGDDDLLISASVRDISDRKQRELEIRRLHALAEAASSAKSEFLASMSHELRTPLNAILGFAQLLQRDRKSPLTDKQRERVDYVLKGGEHLLRLIDDVLDLARIEAGRVLVSPEPVVLHEVLAEVHTTLEPMAARAEVELIVEPVPEGCPQIVADRTRFKQVLMNFGSNAIKYGKRGGRAVVRTEVHGSGMVRVTVSDDGIGIPEDKHDKIFQPFQRAGQEAGSIEGTGIGLTISKRLAELMAGGVGFASSVGAGSEFWIEVPAHRPAPSSGDAAPSQVPVESALAAPRQQRYLVIYIEDNPSNIAFMEDLISDFESVSLVTAPTAEIGLELARARRPDVVIMDINLPGMNGFDATRLLHDWPETHDVPVVALSAAAMAHDLGKSEGVGFYRYLTKPVKVDELAAVLEELLLPHGE
jgi:PAS domain S-box-containing protein